MNSFLENADAIKDVVTYPNVSLMSHVLEWGRARSNLQGLLRTPGINSGLTEP